MDRRTTLAGIGTIASTAVAGCFGSDDDGPVSGRIENEYDEDLTVDLEVSVIDGEDVFDRTFDVEAGSEAEIDEELEEEEEYDVAVGIEELDIDISGGVAYETDHELLVQIREDGDFHLTTREEPTD